LDSNVKVAAVPSSETSTLVVARAASAMVPALPKAASNSDRLVSASTPPLKVTKSLSVHKEEAAI
jgi:hypothetical protein